MRLAKASVREGTFSPGHTSDCTVPRDGRDSCHHCPAVASQPDRAERHECGPAECRAESKLWRAHPKGLPARDSHRTSVLAESHSVWTSSPQAGDRSRQAPYNYQKDPKTE